MKSILLAVMLLPLFTNAQDTTGMIAHWKMNGDASDATGHGHNGMAHNLTATTGYYGKPNTAYYFNGINSFLSTPASAAYNTNKFSICMMFKIQGFYTGTCQDNILFSRASPSISSSPAGHYCLGFLDNPFDDDCGITDTTKDVFNINAGSNVVTPESTWRDTPQLVENQWYKVIAIFDSVNYKLYVNGSLRKTIASPGTPIGVSNDSVVMGMDVWEASSGFPYNFKGVIDDAKLYGRVLADQEISHYGDTCGRINLQPISVSSGVGHDVSFTIGSSLNPVPNYQWQQNAGSGFVDMANIIPYSGVNTNTLAITGITSALNGTIYRCIVGNSWGCLDTSNAAMLTATTGVNNLLYNSPMVSVYPNPAKNNLTIELPGSEGATVQIINAIGQQVTEKIITSTTTQIDVTNLPAGVYIVRVKYQDYIITKKLLKE